MIKILMEFFLFCEIRYFIESIFLFKSVYLIILECIEYFYFSVCFLVVQGNIFQRDEFVDNEVNC